MKGMKIMNTINKNRELWLDALRGLAVLFVILRHQIPKCNLFFVITSPIKIPLFFAITGYLFSCEKYSLLDFFKKRILSLTTAWILLSTISFLPSLILNGFEYFFLLIKGNLLGTQYWYMPCCLIADILFYFICKYSKDDVIRLINCIALFIIGQILIGKELLNIFMLNRSLTVLIFMLFGMMIKKYREYIYIYIQ